MILVGGRGGSSGIVVEGWGWVVGYGFFDAVGLLGYGWDEMGVYGTGVVGLNWMERGRVSHL